MDAEDSKYALLKSELDQCVAFIKILSVRLETATNFQYLANLQVSTAGQSEAFRLMLGEQLALMGEALIEFYSRQDAKTGRVSSSS